MDRSGRPASGGRSIDPLEVDGEDRDLLALAFEDGLRRENLGEVPRREDAGVLNRGAGGGAADSPVGCAHSGQNFAAGDSCRPHLVHARASGVAHSSQNFAPASFSCWHRGHFMRTPTRRARLRSANGSVVACLRQEI